MALLITCIVALGALAYSWFVAHQGEACHKDYGTLKVAVYDTYGMPLRESNVSIYWNGELLHSALTDAEGEVKFKHLYYDIYNITVTKTGCAFEYLYFHFEESQKIQFFLAYLNFSLTVFLRNARTDAVISNATIQLHRYDYTNTYREVELRTNSSGGACFSDLEYDEYGMVVSAEGYFNESRLLFLDQNIWVNITLHPLPGVPDAPYLFPISPNPTQNGTVRLSWTAVQDVALYYVYRDTCPIESLEGLTPIAIAVTTWYEDTLLENGTYYYAVVAGNAQGNSSLSNCEAVVVSIPPIKYLLDSQLAVFGVFGILAVVAGMFYYSLQKQLRKVRREPITRKKYSHYRR